MFKHFLITAFILLSYSSFADEIHLENGSIIKGKVIKIFQDKLLVETDFSPNIELNFAKVKSFTTDEEHSIKLSDGQKLNGKISYAKNEISVKGSITKTTVDTKHFAMLWKKDEKAPDYKAPFKKEWKNTASLDFNKREGNTDEMDLAFKASATLQGEKDKLKFYGEYKRSEKEGEKSADEKIAGVDYEYSYTSDDSWYVRTELEKDEFENLDLRTTVAAGYGHYFYKEKKITLRNRLGLLYRHESYSTDEDDETIGLDLGLQFKYLFTDFGNWYTNLTLAPSIEDLSDYRLKHESGLALPVGGADKWTLKLGVDHEYNSEPAGDNKELDTTYFSRLELNF